MTQTLQQALLKAGLISQEKLKKAEADKKAAQRAQHAPRVPGRGAQVPPSRGPQSQPPRSAPPKAAAPAPKIAAPASKPAAPAPKVHVSPPKPKTEQKPGFIEGKHHHHIRTHCEACGKNSPDVEYYEHRNRALDRYWLCVKCADDNNILDEFRQTVQSSHAQRGFFQRGYGPTKVFRKRL